MWLGLRLGWGQPMLPGSWPREAVLEAPPHTHLITWGNSHFKDRKRSQGPRELLLVHQSFPKAFAPAEFSLWRGYKATHE